MGNDAKINFAVVGAGHIGKRHAEMIRRDAEGVYEDTAQTTPRRVADSGTPFAAANVL